MNEAAPERAKILVVDDNPADLVALRHLLSKVEVDLVEARSGKEALAACLEYSFALILLDVRIPDMDGFEVAHQMGEDSSTRETPIIFVTAAYDDTPARLRGYRSGAVDFMSKPLNGTELVSKVRIFLELHRSRMQMRATLEQMFDLNLQLRDEIAERKRLEALAQHQASHDSLTGLPNRAHFMSSLQKAIERSRRSRKPLALLYIDIDGFKPVNDTHGHHAGDLLLQAITARIAGSVRKADTAARLGGDEFAVIMEEITDVDTALEVAQKLAAALRLPYTLETARGGITAVTGASVGVATCPGGIDGHEALLRAADSAMYRAKRAGKNRVMLAEPEDAI